MDQPLNLKTAWQDAKQWRVPLLVLLCAAVVITLVEYVFLSGSFVRYFPGLTRELAPGVWYGRWPANARAPWWGTLLPWAWWVGGTFTLWVLVPWALAAALGFRPRALGLGWQGLHRKWWMYALLLLLVSPAVIWASTRDSFTQTYPMLRPEYCEQWGWRMLLAWWALYALQFFAVEFFFRGFLLFTLEPKFGLGAIAVMVVPYTMIHFHKPLPEALGAIVAGAVLGWMALRSRSIWGGLCVHVAVAISMDALSLWRLDALP